MECKLMRTAMYNPILCGSPGHTEIENVSHYSNNKYSILGNFLWSGQQHNYSASQPNDLPIYVDVVVVVVAWRKSSGEVWREALQYQILLNYYVKIAALAPTFIYPFRHFDSHY